MGEREILRNLHLPVGHRGQHLILFKFLRCSGVASEIFGSCFHHDPRRHKCHKRPPSTGIHRHPGTQKFLTAQKVLRVDRIYTSLGALDWYESRLAYPDWAATGAAGFEFDLGYVQHGGFTTYLHLSMAFFSGNCDGKPYTCSDFDPCSSTIFFVSLVDLAGTGLEAAGFPNLCSSNPSCSTKNIPKVGLYNIMYIFILCYIYILLYEYMIIYVRFFSSTSNIRSLETPAVPSRSGTLRPGRYLAAALLLPQRGPGRGARAGHRGVVSASKFTQLWCQLRDLAEMEGSGTFFWN